MTTVLRETRFDGPIVDLTHESVEGTRIHEVLGGGRVTTSGETTGTRLYDRIGHVHPQSRPAIRPALGLVMRTQRVETPVDRALATAERRKAAVDVPDLSLAAARADLAAAGEEETALRERVARLGGRVTALRETVGADASADETALETATTALAEAETNHIAAKQRLTRAREEARSVRDRYERRRRLGDRVTNRRQDAHAYLVRHGWHRFRRAIEAMPVDAEVGQTPPEWDGPGWVATLALIHLANLDTPVVVEGDLPRSVTTPAFLGTPVIRV